MEELIVVDFLRLLREFFLWETSLKLLTVLSLLGGAAAEWTILRRNEKWWVFPLLLFGAAAILEGLWQLSVGWSGLIFPICGCFTLLILAGSLLSLILYKRWTQVCDLCP